MSGEHELPRWMRERVEEDAEAPAAYQVGGDHYVELAVQPWEAMRAWMSPAQYRGFLRGNAIKYLARGGAKGGFAAGTEQEDYEKAMHYLAELIETYRD
jgi:hypothetical protein